MRFAQTRRLITAAAFVPLIGSTLSTPLYANELDGAWANERAMCKKMFARTNGKARLVKNADFYGSGFVIDGNTIYAKDATCKITSLAKKGDNVRIVASWATDVMVSKTEFNAVFGQDGRLTRSFPAMPEMSLDYFRCDF